MENNCAFQQYSFYPFVHLSVIKLSARDFASLEPAKALQLPSQPHLEKFVKQYFRFIHPFLPVIDEGHFWQIYLGDKSQDASFSLFVLQAMLFATAGVCGSPFIIAYLEVHSKIISRPSRTRQSHFWGLKITWMRAIASTAVPR